MVRPRNPHFRAVSELGFFAFSVLVNSNHSLTLYKPQEEVRWSGPRNPHFRAVSELGFFASSVRQQIRTAVPTSRLRVTTSAPSPEMEASMARVASPVSSFYVEGEYTAHLHVVGMLEGLCYIQL
jgi:hypothetical protein